MCVPVAMGLYAGALSAHAQGSAAKFEAQQAAANAGYARLSENSAVDRGAAEAGRLRMEGSQVIGQQKVALASSGVDVSSGSALGLFSSTRAASELDARTASHSAALEAWGHRVERTQWKQKERIARRNSVLGPLSAMLRTGASAFSAAKGS